MGKKYLSATTSEKLGNGGLTRRSFLNGALALGAVATGTSLLSGCTSTEDSTVNKETAATVEHNPSETVECDIVVCGSGTGGMCAAVRGAELGGNVLLLEKNAAVGGTSNFAESITGVGTKMQAALGIEINTEELFNSVFTYHHSGANGPVLHSFIKTCGETVDWLVDRGCHFLTVMTFFGLYHTCHLSGDPETGKSMLNGEAIIQPMLAQAESLGVDIRCNTPLTDLLVENGKVTGVYATDENGQEIQINATKGVILATGGYADNKELYEEFTNLSFDNVHAWGMTGRDGDGIKLARALGATLHHPETLNYSGEYVVGTSTFHEPLNQIFAWQQNLRVNENAERFFSEEDISNYSAHGNALSIQAAGYSILDQDLIDTITNATVFTSMPMYDVVIGSPLAGAADAMEQGLGDGIVFKADTIEELAQKLGLDADALRVTIDTYNQMCDAGVDTDYGKAKDFLFPVRTAPFYGARVVPTIYATNGGVKVNEKLQVISGFDIIEGLYAIGNETSAIYGNNYDVQLMPGSCQSWAATGGRLAAESMLGA